jgi:serine/threonine protein kinase
VSTARVVSGDELHTVLQQDSPIIVAPAPLSPSVSPSLCLTISVACVRSALSCCRFPQFTPASWAKVIPSASPDAIDLIAKLTAWDPAKRLSSDQALRHPYFAVSQGDIHSVARVSLRVMYVVHLRCHTHGLPVSTHSVLVVRFLCSTACAGYIA